MSGDTPTISPPCPPAFDLIEFDAGRSVRHAPPMIVGDGANEIRRNVTVRQLLARGGVG